jgi:hypothetical protein
MDSIQVLTVIILVAMAAGFIIRVVSSSRRSRKRSVKVDSRPEEEALRSSARGELAVHRPDLFDAIGDDEHEMSPEEEALESFAEGEYADHLDDDEDD